MKRVESKANDLFSPFRRRLERFDRAVLSGSWLAIVIACTGFALDYLLNLALSQWLNPADLGDYSVAVSIAVFGGMFALLGTDQTLMQFLPQYLEDTDWNRVKGLLTFSFSVVLVTSLMGSGLALGGAFLGPEDWTSHPSLLAFAILPLVSLTLLSSKTLRGFRHIVMATAPTGVVLPLLIMAGGYYLSLQGRVTDWDLVAVFGMSFLLLLLVQMVVVGRHVVGPIGRAQAQYETREWASTSLSLMVAAVLFLAMEQMGIYMCEFLAGEEDVAIYAVLLKHARFLLIIFMAVNLSVIPFISPALRRGDRKELQRLYGTSMHLVMWGGLLPLVVFIIKGEDILEAFGPEYAVGYPGLLVLMGAYYLNFIAGFSVPFLQFSGHRRIVVWSIAVALVVEVILFALLIPEYGFAGACWSMGATLCGLSIWLTTQCWHRLGLRPLGLLHKVED
ncbi:polysaccharide biosynthesis C-terminal domain-containing protein [Terasakiella sp. SH-1]|uniref:lipopolysaccharide biosynthesis protein n=1 Tax=Terasakiella sp. SH-1 TaxID=2560057 RepID=UPI001073B71F|nr:polysaccharide biosynthesis C-terminal domain-containing protein [Terasakiella sp. SH-1]